MREPGFGAFNPLARFGLRLLVGPLRAWDLKASKRPDYYIANSTHIQNDIQRYYNRESTVIHPPIDVDRFGIDEPAKRQGFVIAGRQVPQKKFALAIEACNRLKLPLTVIGKGPEHENLKALAGPTITFTGYVSDEELPAYFANAAGFIFPSHEDFGVAPVEARAAGTPVIAYKAGGSLDYVVEGKTGAFFTEQTTESLCQTLESFTNMSFDHQYIRKAATAFAPEVFDTKMTEFISDVMK